MNKSLPDKWVRKAVFDAINNMSVYDVLSDTNIDIPCYDSRQVSNGGEPYYVLMSTQTNSVDKTTKCENSYQSSILLDVVTSYTSAGNMGSRVLADNILDKARELTNALSLDVSSGLTILKQTEDFPNDLVSITPNENVFRKFMRIELFIN